MKALLYSDWGKIEVADVPKPAPGDGEVLVRVEACGICGSEIECFKDRSRRRVPPLVLGHEFAGRVAALGRGATGFSVGDPVVVGSVMPCGSCFACRRGETNLCPDRKLFGMHRPGGCAEFVAAPASVVFSRPAEMDPVLGSLAEPASNGVHAARLLPGHFKKTVFVIGAGVIGLMAVQAIRAIHGARVAAADVLPNRLAYAETLGAERVVNAATEDIVQAGIEFSGADGVDYVVDAVGSGRTKTQALAMTRPGGAVCWLGLRENETAIKTFEVTLPQKTITGSYAATADEFKEAIALIAQGRIRGCDGIRTWPLENAAEAFERMCDPACPDLKAVVLP